MRHGHADEPGFGGGVVFYSVGPSLVGFGAWVVSRRTVGTASAAVVASTMMATSSHFMRAPREILQEP